MRRNNSLPAKREINKYVSARIKRLMADKNYSIRSLAEKLNIPKTTIHYVTSGKNLKISPNMLVKFAGAFGTTVDYLLTGNEYAKVKKSDVILHTDKKSYKMLPDVPVISWDEVREWRLDKDMLLKKKIDRESYPVPGASPQCFILIVENDTMVSPHPNADSFAAGEWIVIDPEKPVKDGAYIICHLDEKSPCTFKQYKIIDKKPMLKTLNPQYQAIPLPSTATIEGVVKHKITHY